MAVGVGSLLGGTILGGGVAQHEGAGEAAKQELAGIKLGIKEQRAARESAEARLQPFTEIGLEAGGRLQSLLADPSQGLEEINPIVDLLRNQGFEQIQESAAAGGRLGAGGTLKDLTQFNTDLTSTIVPQLQNQRFNQLFNVLGLGQNAAAGQGTSTLQTSANISNLLSAGGRARAEGTRGETQAITNTLGNISSLVGAF